MNFQVFRHKVIDSTNLEARRLIDTCAVQNATIVTAQVQESGRGRLDRVWKSYNGNIAFSCIFPKQWVKNSTILPACVCIGIFNAITPNGNVYFKWPNDLILHEDGLPKKFCGILIEFHRDFCIVGIGVNILQHPEETMFPATNLQKHGLKIQNEEQIFNNILSLLNASSGKMLSQWNQRNAFQGKTVTIGKNTGVFLEADTAFNAVLSVNGEQKTIQYGDVL